MERADAWPLDERRLKEWLDLSTDDVLYFMPRRKNVPLDTRTSASFFRRSLIEEGRELG